MAGQVWPAPEIAKRSKDAVFLSVYRYAEIPAGARADGAPASGARSGKSKGSPTDPSDWAIRLDVQAYPQFRILDGWGRPVEESDRHANARSVEQVLAAADVAKKAHASSAPPDVRLPAALLDRIPKEKRETAASPDADARVRLWRELLEGAKWDPKLLAALVTADSDPVVRLEALERFPAEAAPPECLAALRLGVEGDNDYVRSRCLELLGGAGAPGAAAILEVIDRAMDGQPAWRNPNNVLIGALNAAEKSADPSLVPALGKVVRKVGTNNSALVVATKALAAIAEKHGLKLVREHLKAARDREEGPVMAQVRRIADDLLGRPKK